MILTLPSGRDVDLKDTAACQAEIESVEGQIAAAQTDLVWLRRKLKQLGALPIKPAAKEAAAK